MGDVGPVGKPRGRPGTRVCALGPPQPLGARTKPKRLIKTILRLDALLFIPASGSHWGLVRLRGSAPAPAACAGCARCVSDFPGGSGSLGASPGPVCSAVCACGSAVPRVCIVPGLCTGVSVCLLQLCLHVSPACVCVSVVRVCPEALVRSRWGGKCRGKGEYEGTEQRVRSLYVCTPLRCAPGLLPTEQCQGDRAKVVRYFVGCAGLCFSSPFFPFSFSFPLFFTSFRCFYFSHLKDRDQEGQDTLLVVALAPLGHSPAAPG